tara:strand:+ start:219 stop:521 length:303 start_codon:yes stop_codon:yes gene_type:complete
MCSRLLQFALTFNSDLNAWDVSQVTTMQSMFNVSTPPLERRPRTRKVRPAARYCTDLSDFFACARLLQNAEKFNSTLNAWDVSQVTTMQRMFAVSAPPLE